MSKRRTIRSLFTRYNSVIHNSVIFNEDNDLTLQWGWGLSPNYVIYLFYVNAMCYNIHTKQQTRQSSVLNVLYELPDDDSLGI